MKKLVVFAVLAAVEIGYGAFEHVGHGSRSAAMGNSLVAVRGNEWSVYSNPALLHTIKGRTCSFSYAPRPFEMKELARAAASFVEPVSFGAFALSASMFGFELYKETALAVSYANEIATFARAGVTVNYYSLSIQNYGTASTISADVGFLVEVSDDVNWGFAAFNVNSATIGTSKEKLPQVFSTGVAYNPIGSATLTASVAKDVRYPAALCLGVEYSVLDIVALRAGTSGEPSTLNAGIGIAYSFVQLDYAFSSHGELGPSHHFSISLRLSDF